MTRRELYKPKDVLKNTNKSDKHLYITRPIAKLNVA